VTLTPVHLARLIAQEKVKCIECSWCCANCSPISLDPRDIKRLSKCFGISTKKVMRRYVDYYDGKTVLKNALPCEFLDLDGGLCKIYKHRPNVCREFPFLATEHRDQDSFWVLSQCPASTEYFNTYMKNNVTFNAIMERTSSPVFMKNVEKTMRRILKNKLKMEDF
jgi:Fe-S-cluster containining protein